MRGEKQKVSWVYVVCGEGEDTPCKIGITFNLHRRMRELQTSADRRLEFAAKFEIERTAAALAEKRAHRRLSDKHASGEWYHVTRAEAAEAVKWAIERTLAKRQERADRIANDPAEQERVRIGQAVADAAKAAPAPVAKVVKRAGGIANRTSDDEAKAVVDAVLDKMADGATLGAALAAIPDAPTARTFYKWLDRFPEAVSDYRRARSILADRYVDRIITVVDDTVSGALDPNAARVAIEGLRWTASKLAPRDYGDRIDVTATTQTTVQVGYVIRLDDDRAALPGDVARMIDVTPAAAIANACEDAQD